jgi:alcohol dehydrogenase (cytochrome c)
VISSFTKGATRAVALVLALGLLGVSFGAPAAVAAHKPSLVGSWPYSNADLANSRDAVGSTITLSNVSTLKKVWSFKLTGKATGNVGGYGTLAANPIVVNNVVYIQDLHSNVYALSLATGKLEWSYLVNKKEKSGPGPNGVAVVYGMVYGATPTTVFALNEATGHLVWSDKNLLKKDQGTFGIQPQVANGRVYLASQYGRAPGGGLLLALNATNGDLLWSFKSVPKKEAGVEKLGLGTGERGKRRS